jgi:hypothetical protein
MGMIASSPMTSSDNQTLGSGACVTSKVKSAEVNEALEFPP